MSLGPAASLGAAALLTLLVLVQTPASGQSSARSAPGDSQPLPAPGTAIERRISGKQSDTFRMRLEPGHYLGVTIRQRGLNVVMAVTGPDGREAQKVDAFDDPHREETLAFVASAEGEHTLTVAPVAASDSPGDYVLHVDALRPATTDDASRVDAERRFVSGIANRLRNQADGWRAAVTDFDAALALYTRLSDRPGQMKTLIELGRALYLLSRPEAL
jgi:hypothetical protein